MVTFPSYAADIYYYPTQQSITVIGLVKPDDAFRFQDILDSHKNVKTVLISGPGGDTLAGFDIGLAIKEKSLNVHAFGVCASTCANIFLAGNTSTVDRGAKVLAHNPFLTTIDNKTWAIKETVSNYALALQGWYLGQLGFGVDVITNFELLIPPDNTPFNLLSGNSVYKVSEWHYTIKRRHY